MAGKIRLIDFGGTILMKQNSHQGYTPFYSLQDVAIYDMLRHLPDGKGEEAIQQLLERGGGGYQRIAPLFDTEERLGPLPTQRAAFEFLLTKANEALAKLGYESKVRYAGHGPIDSINLEVRLHYRQLLEAVLETIKEGDIPVIVGGTDTLRFYGTQLNEDIRHLQSREIIRDPVPVLIASSMYAFSDKPEHVYRILRAARIAAQKLAFKSDGAATGVYSLSAVDEEVSQVRVTSLNQPFDKISGSLLDSFVSEKGGEIYKPDEAVDGDVYSLDDKRRYDNSKAEIPYPSYRYVAPSLEASNSTAGIAQFLRYELKKPLGDVHHRFDAILIKGDLRGATPSETNVVADAIARLRQAGTDVFFVNDPKADMTKPDRPLVFDKSFGMSPNAKVLQSAGAIFLDGMSSTQAYIRASMMTIENDQPLRFDSRRSKSAAAAEAYLQQHGDQVLPELPPAKAIALEYVPKALEYIEALRMAAASGAKKIISVNCSDGAISDRLKETLSSFASGLHYEHPPGPFEPVQIICSFKYAGTKFPGQREPETASMDTYWPARNMRKYLSNMQAGGAESPEAIMRRELGLSRA